MALTKTQKKEIIDNLAPILKESQSVALLNITGIKNNDFIKLKFLLKQASSNIKVVKKTLMNIAFQNAGFEKAPLEEFKVSCALIPSKKDPIDIMKILDSFAKNVLKKNLTDLVLGGFVDKHYVDKSNFCQYAYLPSAEELYAKLAVSITYPLRKLALDFRLLSGLKLVQDLKILTQTKS